MLTHITTRETMINLTITASEKNSIPPHVAAVRSKLSTLAPSSLSGTQQIDADSGTIFRAAYKLLSILKRSNDGLAVHKVSKEAITTPPYEFLDGISESIERVIGTGFVLSMDEEDHAHRMPRQAKKSVIVITLQLANDPSLPL